MKNEAGHPHVIAALDALAGTHLVLPLRWHHLRVGTADLHACVQARQIMSFDDVPAVDLVSADSAVIGPCGPGNPDLGQPKGCPSTSSKVYSCSTPNHGRCSAARSINFLHLNRLLVSWGLPA